MGYSSQILTSNLCLKGNANLDTFEKSYQQQEEEYNQQVKILNKQNSFTILQNNLSKCGHISNRYWYCKECKSQGREALLRIDRNVRRDCQNKYCSKCGCINTRFARTYNRLLETEIKILGNDGKPIEIKPLDSQGKPFIFKGMKKKYKTYSLSKYPDLFHFSIGFPHADINKKNLNNQKRVINSYLSKLRKEGIKLNAIQTMDISKGDRKKEWDGKYFIHYHFMAIPFKKDRVRSSWITMRKVEKEMVTKQRVKYPFNVKFHTRGGIYKDRYAMLSYLTVRSIGLFKPYEDKETNKTLTPKKLSDSVNDGKYMFFSDIMSLEDYFKLFHKRRMLSVIGGRLVIPQSSILLDNVAGTYPDLCKCCGHLERHQVCFRDEDVLIAETPPDRPETITYTIEHIKSNSPIVSESRLQLLKMMQERGIKVQGINC